MTPLYKMILCIGLSILLPLQVYAASVPKQVEQVIQKGFPQQLNALKTMSNTLFQEYQRDKNITSLVFYAYSVLELAKYYKSINDYVNASEQAKLGFFYLDEAAESDEENLNVLYLRARVDAYLPADLGRCVIALSDTQILLNHKEKFDADILARINHMRYRALNSCGESSSANALLQQLKKGNVTQQKLLVLPDNQSPEWDIYEITQILMPLMKQVNK
ncbi:hypothetical protein B9T31_09225 [Acinetobacter sp. ANC 4558]|uniref:hypothetical protein n=1 Tax=Acinetobacter sp. ANC 4558 TaxID=1977876 RepID=UPI000A34A65C|nr:hypothetical protein [Acinetobacter sp. ANC 4558]OTG86207.1 hypothetical protein B9T31_09225 [Acinetobacter sp. ANC 4558]